MRVHGLLVAVLLTVGVSNAAAQTSPYFGVKAGVNFAKIDFDEDDEFTDQLDRRTGLVAGLFMVYPVRDTFGFQVEGLFSQKGFQFEEQGFEGKTEIDYFEVPVLARFSVPSTTGTSFHVYAGPSLGFKLRARDKASFEGEEDEEDISEDVKSFDLGLAVGAGVEFGRLVIDGRYTHGLSEINKSEDEVSKAKNRVFSIMAGFRF